MTSIRLLLLVTMLLALPGSAGATLIGDTVTIAHHCCALGTVASGGGPVNSTVEAGMGDILLFS